MKFHFHLQQLSILQMEGLDLSCSQLLLSQQLIPQLLELQMAMKGYR
jgi:hypothetical protein